MKTELSLCVRKRILSVLLLVSAIFLASMSYAQSPSAILGQPSVVPIVDGTIDQVWGTAQAHPIALPYLQENPTLGIEGETYWKGLWTMEGIYILVNVVDNVFSPAYAGTGYTMDWMYDKVELYIDANYVQKDGLGAAHGKGHYCFAPAPTENMIRQGQAASISNGKSTYCYKVSNQSYVAEYYIPFTELLDKNGLPLDKSGHIGFDVTITDNDLKTPMRNRMVWSNNGRMDESWYNMDDAGLIVLSTQESSTDTIPNGDDPWSHNNLIRNWNFTSDLTNWGSWVDGTVAGQKAVVIENGVVKMATGKASDGAPWHYQLYQTDLQAQANVPYILTFKSWSSVPRTNRVDFEDSPENGYTRYGASTDAQAIGGRSEWEYNTTTVPQWFAFHVVFDQIKSTTPQKVQWMLSSENAITYLDSILLMKADDTTGGIPHYLIASVTQIDMKAEAETATITLTSDVNWTASVDQVWLTVRSNAGSGNATLSVSAQANASLISRTATIRIKAPDMTTQLITVTQQAKSALPNQQGTLTYGENWNNEVWNYQNLIKNWDFTTDLTSWGNWVDGVWPGQQPPLANNGIATMTTIKSPDGYGWHYQLWQRGLKAEANVPYILKFKAWSDESRTNGLAFEDSPENNYNRYGASPDADAIKGRSEWTYNTTTEPRWFTFHMVFDQMVPTTDQKIQWMLSTANATTYLDSVILIKDGDSTANNASYIIISTSKINLMEKVANAYFTITSNAPWEVHSDQAWINVDQSTGTGNQTITLTAMANTEFTIRTAKITIYATSLEPQTITVAQMAKLPISEDPQDTVIVENWSSEAWNSYNLIKNWDFTTDLTYWDNWIDIAITDQLAPAVSNGIATMRTGVAMDGYNWLYQLIQRSLEAEPNVPYTLKFKAWSSIPRSNGLVFEDTPENNYNRYGASTDAEALNGRSEWVYYTTPTPRWFTFHVVFDRMNSTTLQKIQWMLSTAGATSFLDSVILIKDADLMLIKEAQLALSANQLKVGHTEVKATVDVSSNTNSMAITDQEWISVSPTTVTGNKTLTIATKANPDITSRTATVTIYPAGLKAQTITVVQSPITAINQLTDGSKMTLYPNPSNGKVKLVLDRVPEKGTYLTVHNPTGKLIINQPVESMEQWIDLQGNPPGVYFLSINLNDSKAQKIILK